jgi:hypothetical protein
MICRTAPAIPEPAAVFDRAAVVQCVPQAVDLGLVIAFDDDREAVIKGSSGPASIAM